MGIIRWLFYEKPVILKGPSRKTTIKSPFLRFLISENTVDRAKYTWHKITWKKGARECNLNTMHPTKVSFFYSTLYKTDDCTFWPLTYSLFQNKRTFNSGGGGPKIHMVYNLNCNALHARFFSFENQQPFWRHFKKGGSISQTKNCSFHNSP